MELSVRGYSARQYLYLSKILSVLYSSKATFTKDRFEQVQEQHRKGIESSEAEPLKTQAKYILSYILCPKTFHRSDRLQQLSTVKFEDVLVYIDKFLLSHSVECFFFGNLRMKGAERLTNIAIESRKKYLEERVENEKLQIDVNPYLEDWFLKNPIERIVVLEETLQSKGEMQGKQWRKLRNVLATMGGRKEVNNGYQGDIVIEVNCDDTNGIEQLKEPPLLKMNHVEAQQEHRLSGAATVASGEKVSSIQTNHQISHNNSQLTSMEHQLSTIEEEEGKENRGKLYSTTDDDDDENEGEDLETKRGGENKLGNQTKIEFILPKSKNRQNLFIIHNEVQSSSCVLFYLQYLQNIPKHAALLETFFQIVREHLVSSMRYMEALGYVVNCDIRKGNSNATTGFRIIVESHYPLAVVHSRIEESILSLNDYLFNDKMSVDTFEMGKSALIIGKKEFWNNRMVDRATALWREVSDETYCFDRIQSEIECIEKISLDEIRQFYVEWIHPAGNERRHLTLSIGPDPMLNKLDIMLEGTGEHQVRHWDIKELEIYRKDAKCFPQVSDDNLKWWYQQVFDSEDNTYQAPPATIYTDYEDLN